MSSPTLSFAQTYILASKVRSKLTKEASSPKSQLRNLVVQANMLDNLMDYISDETEKRTKLQQQQQQQEAANKSKVHFDLPTKNTQPIKRSRRLSDVSQQEQPHFHKTSITEYEIDSESDEDEVDPSDTDSEQESDEEYEIDTYTGVSYTAQHTKNLQLHKTSTNVENDYPSSDDDSDDDDYYVYSDSEDVDEDLSTPRSLAPNHNTLYKQLPFMNLFAIEEETEDNNSHITDELPELTKSNSLTDEEVETHDEQLILPITTEENHHEKPMTLFKHESVNLL